MELLSDSILEEFENLLTVRNILAKPPKEAYYYFPNEKEQIEIDMLNRKHSIRRIFDGLTEFNEFENHHLVNFRQELKFFNLNLHNNVDRSTCLRFLQAASYNYVIAIRMIVDCYEWRKKYFPINNLNNKQKEILNSGFIYVFGRDNRFRPLIVINPEFYLRNIEKYTVDDMLNSFVYLLEYLIKNVMIPGQVENWNLICDVSNCSIISVPKELRLILNGLNRNYKCRLYSMYIVNFSNIFTMIWKAIKNMLNPITERKIKFLYGKDCEDLFKNINKSQVERKFGGTAENVSSHFFPPMFPSNNYFTDDDNPDQILINEYKYLEVIRSGSIIQNCTAPRRDSHFTFDAIDFNYKKSEASYYEDAKSVNFSQKIQESYYTDCLEYIPAKEINLNKVCLEESLNNIDSDNKDTIRISEENNEVNLAKEKSFEVDSFNTNITQHRKIY